jgi:diadenosine tetraphosphate (Ap4A) HIT family hydrolase
MTILHPQLAADCLVLGRFELCHVLLMKDANYPWFILVPDREDIREIFQLSEIDRQRLMLESSVFGELLYREFEADKLNIAALGNVVPQLHIHHVVRYQSDAAWPAPVWGKVPAQTYSPEQLTEVSERIIRALEEVPELGFNALPE